MGVRAAIENLRGECMGDSNDGDFRLLAQSEAKPECTMRGEIADQDVRQRLVIVLVLRGAHRWRLRGLQDGARAVPALAGKPRLEKSLVVHGGDDVDGWFRYGELRASSARDAGDSLKVSVSPEKSKKKIQEKHFKEKSALHAPSVAVVRSFMVNLGGPPATCLDRRLYFPLWLGSSIGGSGIRIELKNQEVITPCRCRMGFGRSQLPLVGIVDRALPRTYRCSPREKRDFTAAHATARCQRKLLATRQPGDLGGLGCAPTNRPLVACAGCRIDGFRVEGGLETSAD